MDEFLFAKRSRLEFCVQRARACIALPSELPFEQDETRQDAAGLSVLRAIELAIGIANYVIHKRGLDVPQSSRASFELLEREEVINPELASELKSMVDFRNLLVLRHTELDPHLFLAVIESRLDHLVEFSRVVLTS
ncbi:COG2445 Uncharacterized conserved protein [Fimbriimonadaceae bacterium]